MSDERTLNAIELAKSMQRFISIDGLNALPKQMRKVRLDEYDAIADLSHAVVALKSELETTTAQRDRAIDASNEGAWMAKALDAAESVATLTAQLARCKAALKEACDMAEAWIPASDWGMPNERAHIAALRKVAE